LFSFLGKAIAALALFALVTSAVFFLLIRHEHNTPLTLPQPSGRFAVGRVTYAWTNSAAPDELSPIRGAPRQLMVWIWYPAAPTASGAPAPYVPAAWRAAIAPHGSMAFVTRNLALVRAHSVSGAPVARDDRSYPVVIMRAGGGAPTTDFTTLAEDLASHGYVVVGFDAAYRTYAFMLPDGRIVDRPPGNDPEDLNPEQADHLINKLLPMWTSDAAFVADQLQQLNAGDPTGRFTGRLDLDQLGMFGHSFGGAQALQFCHDDVRCKAGIDIDGAPYGSVVRDGVKEPFMIVLSDHSREMGDPASRQIVANLQLK
jgi:predicted dienelactone hydrolase